MIIGVYLITLATLNVGAALVIFFGALGKRLRLYPAWHKVGLICAAFGLVSSSHLYLEMVLDGSLQMGFIRVLFLTLKDVGICIIGGGYLILALRGPRKEVD